jgi:DNA helicase-4
MKKIDIDEVNGIKLDNYQKKIIEDDSRNLLVVAGAGSGKTLTIIGKIKYLIEIKKIKPKEILCISFTNETVNNLINKVGYNVDCFTFHKLALEIIKSYKIDYNVAPDDLLDYLASEYFSTLIYIYDYQKYVSDYLSDNFKNKYTYDEIRLLYPEILDNYINSILSFIRMIKGNNHNVDNFHNYLSKVRFSDKNKSFLIIVFHIYKLYLEELSSTYSLDFDDMITLAT